MAADTDEIHIMIESSKAMSQQNVQRSPSEVKEALEKIYVDCDDIDAVNIRKIQIAWVKDREAYTNDELREYTLSVIESGKLLVGNKREY